MSKKMHIKLNVNGKDEEFLAEPRELSDLHIARTAEHHRPAHRVRDFALWGMHRHHQR